MPLGLSANTSTDVSSKSGDASAGFTSPVQYNGEVILGGSGGATQNVAPASNGTAPDSSSGIGGLSPAIIQTAIFGFLGLMALSIYARRAR